MPLIPITGDRAKSGLTVFEIFVGIPQYALYALQISTGKLRHVGKKYGLTLSLKSVRSAVVN